jgi:hypothetical protein
LLRKLLGREETGVGGRRLSLSGESWRDWEWRQKEVKLQLSWKLKARESSDVLSFIWRMDLGIFDDIKFIIALFGL